MFLIVYIIRAYTTMYIIYVCAQYLGISFVYTYVVVAIVGIRSG